MRLAYCTGIRRWPCSTNTTLAMMARPKTQTPAKTRPPLLRMLAPSAGIRAAIEVKISSDMPLPMPRSVTCSPSHMMTAVPAVMAMTMIGQVEDAGVRDDRQRAVAEQLPAVGQRDDAGALQDGQRDRQVAGVLGQLVLTRLPFLLQLLEPRDDHGEQLHDDARRDVGHDAQREDRQLQQRAAGEQVEQRVDAGVLAALDLPDALLHVGVGDARATGCVAPSR